MRGGNWKKMIEYEVKIAWNQNLIELTWKNSLIDKRAEKKSLKIKRNRRVIF